MADHIIDEAIDYASRLFEEDASGHDLGHSLRVWRGAMLIARNEPSSDAFVVALAAILHDVDDHKLFLTRGNANARAFLDGVQVDPDKVERICEAINSVLFSQNRGRRPSTIEGKIVQDADRLDAIGAIGIARAFAYGGAHGRGMESSVRHFHEKLLLLVDEMNTDMGRKLAESRHAFLLAFLDEFSEEMSLTV